MSYFLSALILNLVRFIRGAAPEDDSIRYSDKVANLDGIPIYIGYGNVHVSSPNKNHKVTWTYASELPHGDSINLVSLDDKPFPGYYWGRGHAWSPSSDYFTLERRAEVTSLYVVRVSDCKWTKVAERTSTVSFVYPLLTHQSYDDPSIHEYFNFPDSQVWTSVHDT